MKRQKKKLKTKTKGVRITLRISEHDLAFKAAQADRFIKKGHKVRIELVLKGREYTHLDLARKKFDGFIGAMKEKIEIEQEPKRQRMGLAMIITKHH